MVLYIGISKVMNNSSTILDKKLSLKYVMKKSLPQSFATRSYLISRADCSGNASMTVYKTNEHLSSFRLDVVDNNHLLAYRLNHI